MKRISCLLKEIPLILSFLGAWLICLAIKGTIFGTLLLSGLLMRLFICLEIIGLRAGAAGHIQKHIERELEAAAFYAPYLQI